MYKYKCVKCGDQCDEQGNRIGPLKDDSLSTTLMPIYGKCCINRFSERKTLHRKNAPETSVTSAYNVDLNKNELIVINALKAAGERGATVKEIWKQNIDKPYSSISARPAKLEEDGLIYYTGDKRDGARVMRLKVVTLA